MDETARRDAVKDRFRVRFGISSYGGGGMLIIDYVLGCAYYSRSSVQDARCVSFSTERQDRGYKDL